MDFKNLVSAIRKGRTVASGDLLPFLSTPDRRKRGDVNRELAEAFADVGNLAQAAVFVRRAWILSDFSTDVLPLYVRIHAGLSDIEAIREAYKTLGMAAVARGDVADALANFNLWHYAYANHLKVDRYAYDWEVLAGIRKMAEPWRFETYPQRGPLNGRKIRLAYLVFGARHLNSVLVKINGMLARYHDRERFETIFFIPDPKHLVYQSRHARQAIKQFQEYGCKVVIPPAGFDLLKRLRAVATQIHETQPDMLITSAVLAEFEHYFIASLRPAPLTVGLIQGPPAQFAAPDLDWGISWSKHPLIDAPCNVSGVHIGLDLPAREAITPYAKRDFQIPEQCRVMMSGGRFFKFENVDFWKAVLRLLSKYSDLHYVAFGVSREQIPFLEPLLTSEISSRVHLLGWREDSLRILSLADILVDTYPSGGGHILIDAMSLGIPFVSFENNYMKNFDQTDWSVADEFVSIPELLVPRGDFGQFEHTFSRLLDDDAYRHRMGNLCREQIQQSMGDPEAGVRRYEEVIMDILHRKVSRQVDAESGGLGRGGDSRSTLGKWGEKIRDSLTGK